MKINVALSYKIKVISLILMIMVMYIHSINIYNNNTEIILNYSENISSQFVVFFQLFISDGISRIAVPFFFLISGYLFFLNVNNISQIYKYKITNGVKTLIIPYLFWSMLVIVIFIILQALPYSESFFNGKHVVDFNFLELMNALLISPLNYPLWFLRDLIIVVFIYSPLIFIFLRFLPKFYLSLLLILWFMDIDQVENLQWFLRFMALLFFSIGGYLSFYKINIEIVFSNKSLNFSLILFLLVLICKTLIQMNPLYTNSYIVDLLLKGDILIGIFILWNIVKIEHNKIIDFLIPYTFLYYVFQEPFITINKKISFFLLGFNPYSALIAYIITPVFVIVFLTLLGKILQKHIPVISKIITGNRL
jgi:surface polysaccharide O-acyltransferase-like enzyme